MTTVYDIATVRARLVEFIAQHGYRTAAEKIGIKHPYLAEVARGDKPPSDKVLAGLGLRWAIVDKGGKRG